MSDPLRIDIPLILPEVTDAADRCVERLAGARGTMTYCLALMGMGVGPVCRARKAAGGPPFLFVELSSEGEAITRPASSTPRPTILRQQSTMPIAGFQRSGKPAIVKTRFF